MHHRDNEMTRADEIKAVVERRDFPPFIHAVSVSLGEYEGEPAAWITFKAESLDGMDVPALKERGRALSMFRHSVFRDLMDHSIGPYPYFRFEDAGRH